MGGVMGIKMRCIVCSNAGLARVWYYDEKNGKIIEKIRLLSNLSNEERKEFEFAAWKLFCPDCLKVHEVEVVNKG